MDGNVQKMHKLQRVKANAKGGNKAIVMRMLEHGGQVRAHVIASRGKLYMEYAVAKSVAAGPDIMTGEFPTYNYPDTPYNREASITLWSMYPVTFTHRH